MSGKNGAPPQRTRSNSSKISCTNASVTVEQQNHRRSKEQRQHRTRDNAKLYNLIQPTSSSNNCSYSRPLHNTAQQQSLSHEHHTHTLSSHSMDTHTFPQQHLMRPSFSLSDRGFHHTQPSYCAKTLTSWHAQTCLDTRRESGTLFTNTAQLSSRYSTAHTGSSQREYRHENSHLL